MNYFVCGNGILYIFAAASSLWYGHALWAVVWLSYGLSALVLATLEAQP